MDWKRIVVAVAALLSGCAAQLPSITRGEEVAIITSGTTHPSIDLYNNAMGQSARSGATGGAVAGALYGLACGPFAPACVPMGALLFGGMGALGGVAVGATQGPEAEVRTRLLEHLTSHGRIQLAEREMVDSISATASASGHWRIVPDSAATSIVVKLDEVALHARRGDRVALGMKAIITVRRSGPAPANPLDTKVFQYLGPESDVRVWLMDRGDFAAESIRQAVRHIAYDVVMGLSR